MNSKDLIFCNSILIFQLSLAYFFKIVSFILFCCDFMVKFEVECHYRGQLLYIHYWVSAHENMNKFSFIKSLQVCLKIFVFNNFKYNFSRSLQKLPHGEENLHGDYSKFWLVTYCTLSNIYTLSNLKVCSLGETNYKFVLKYLFINFWVQIELKREFATSVSLTCKLVKWQILIFCLN